MTESVGHLPVARRLLSGTNPRHPLRSREAACPAFAEIDLAGLARFRPGEDIGVGELQTSERFLADRWGWSRGRVRRFLAALEEEGRIARRATEGAKQAGVIRLLTWDQDFQMGDPQTGPQNGAQLMDYRGSAARKPAQRRRRGKEEGSRTTSGSRREPFETVGIQEELAEAILDDPAALLRSIGDLPGFRSSDAEWLFRQIKESSRDDRELARLSASALDDMARKRHAFTRRRFVGFLSNAARYRTASDGAGKDFDQELLRELRAVFEVAP